MADERAASTAFRSAQSEAFYDFVADMRAAWAYAVAEDEANLEAAISERISTFDAFLDA
jgi:hypothetical protein